MEQTHNKEENLKIKFISYGLGNLIDGTIYLNKALKKYPKLMETVIQHERKHHNGESLVDFREPFHFDLFLFSLITPSTWVHYIPIWITRDNGRWIISFNYRYMALFGFLVSWFLLLYLAVRLS